MGIHSSDHERMYLSERVAEYTSGGGEYFVLPASIKDVVSFTASFINPPRFQDAEDLIRDLTVSMLDKGTKRRSKIEIAELLESRGARLRFRSSGIRVRISGRALKEDLPLIFELLSEQLREPEFDVDEYVRLRDRFIVALQHGLAETDVVSSDALSRILYPVSHPNHVRDASSEITRLQGVSRDDLANYFDNRFRIADWRMVLVGDLALSDIERMITRLDIEPTVVGSIPTFSVQERKANGEIVQCSIPDRANVDVRFGHQVDISSVDPDYLPLFVGNYILGGNFSARLMQTIRDDMGLTYGIRSSLQGFDRHFSGNWDISVTLGTENLEPGIEATTEQLAHFCKNGITEAELEEKKETIRGAFATGMSTTASLAETILRNAEKERDVGFLDTYRDRVQQLTVARVNEAIRSHLDSSKLHCVAAGTIPEKWSTDPVTIIRALQRPE